MRRFWNVVIPLAAAAMLAGLAALNRPSSALSAVKPSAKKSAAGRPTTRPAGTGRRGGSDFDGPRGFRGSMKLTAEQEKDVLGYLKSRRPGIYEEVIAQREKDPSRFRRTLGKIYPFIVRMRKLPEPVAQAYEALQQTHVNLWRLAREYNSADSADKKRDVESRMMAQARRQFEAEQLVRGHRLADLEEQIRDLKAELDQRAKDREAVIKETVDRFKRGSAHYKKNRDRPSSSGERSDRPRPSQPKKAGKKADKPKG